MLLGGLLLINKRLQAGLHRLGFALGGLDDGQAVALYVHHAHAQGVVGGVLGGKAHQFQQHIAVVLDIVGAHLVGVALGGGVAVFTGGQNFIILIFFLIAGRRQNLSVVLGGAAAGRAAAAGGERKGQHQQGGQGLQGLFHRGCSSLCFRLFLLIRRTGAKNCTGPQGFCQAARRASARAEMSPGGRAA